QSIAAGIPYVFKVQETAPRSGKFQIVEPFRASVHQDREFVCDVNSAATLLAKTEQWKQDIARGRTTQKELARRLEKSEAWVSATLRIAKIPRSVRARLARNPGGITRNSLLRLANCP